MNQEFPQFLPKFKSYFASDFNYEVITNSDIETAYKKSLAKLARCLRDNEYAFLYLVAHMLFSRLGDGKGGEVNKMSLGIVSAKKLDNSMVHYEIPDAFLKDPRYIFFKNTKYGIEYLSYLYDYACMPYVGIVGGRSQPD